MIYSLLAQKYFDWMVGYVWTPTPNGPSYHRLFSFLFDIPFTPANEMDQARASDGMQLRWRFGEETGIPPIDIQQDLSGPCSVLEMMVALAIRMEEHIMEDVDMGNRTGQWFWSMILSLGLNEMNDNLFNETVVDDVINRFMAKVYEPSGKGGLFTINNPTIDMRALDIWYQMQVWISENYF